MFFSTKCEKCRDFSQLMQPLEISKDKDIVDSRQVDVNSSSVMFGQQFQTLTQQWLESLCFCKLLKFILAKTKV